MKPARWQWPLILATTVVIGACGGNATPSAGGATTTPATGGSATQKVVLKVTLGHGGVAATLSQAALALQLGFFAEEGLDAEVRLEPINKLGQVVAGSVDLYATGIPSALLLAKEGKPTTIIYGGNGNGTNGALGSNPAIKSIEELRNKKDCTIATTVGSSPFGYANYYIKSLSLPCTIRTFGSSDQTRQAAVGGQADAVVFSYDQGLALVAEGKLNLLIDPTNPSDRQKYISKPGLIDETDVAWFGLTSYVTSNKETILRVLRAFDKVDKAVHRMTPLQIAEAARKQTGWEAVDVNLLAKAYEVDLKIPFMSPFRGYITETNYNTFVTAVGDYYSIDGFDSKNPLFDYKSRVDMSYYLEAIGKP
jgi:ABC-type nitrate/sulfonate/bicarbonate transport system substrate-binding protein